MSRIEQTRYSRNIDRIRSHSIRAPAAGWSAAQFLPHCPKQGATHLLRLIDQKR
ncbi:MAG: hypothetical protein IID46_09610 [Planctomycetes bacterium]|nr:hypothetical protein [Planctomycetota bacterium]